MTCVIPGTTGGIPNADKTYVDTAVGDMGTAYAEATTGQTAGTGAFLNVGAGTLGTLGVSQHFVPGVYTWGTAVTITDDIYLDGSSTDLWVFQIAGTLDISSAKQIHLTGGALAKNVFWAVTGVTTLGTTSVFEGNILTAATSHIMLLTGATLHGRALSDGEVWLQSSTVTIPPAAPPTTGPVFIDTNGDHIHNVGVEKFFFTIQAAIDDVDAAVPGNTIDVTAGAYNEGNTARDIYTGASGGPASGLLVYKNGLTIEGVDGSGNLITDRTGVVATIIAMQRDASLGDTIVTGDNVILSGLRFQLANLPVGCNKNVFATGENFILKNSIVDNLVTGCSGLYLSDERGGMHVNSFTIQDNQFLYGEITIINGVGQTGLASGRKITGNSIEHVTDWAGISMTGITGSGWTTQPIGDVTITGNTFTDNAYQIIARASDYANPAGYWTGFLSSNIFDKAVLTLTPDGDARTNAYGRLSLINDLTDPSKNIYFRMIGTDIQEGIDRADDGDTINVAAGTYTENVNVNKRLTLRGASSATVTVTAATQTLSVFTVTANNVSISGFTVSGATGGGQAGIFIGASMANCNVFNNILTGSFDGIWLGSGSNHNTLTNNVLSSNYQGFEVYISNYNTFTNNIANSNTKYGFKIDSGNHNTFTGNTANSNGDKGFYSVAGGGGGSTNSIFISNTANLNTRHGIHLIGSNVDATLTGNTFNGNLVTGIKLQDTVTNLNMHNNKITNNPTGVGIDSSVIDIASLTLNNNNIAGNTVKGVSNLGTGILNAINNWWGVATGPTHVSNPNGTGDVVSNNVDFDPWYNNIEMTTLSNAEVTDATYSSTIAGQADLPNGATEVTLTDMTVMDLSAGLVDDAVTLNSGVLGDPIVLTNSDLSGVSASIPDGTTIQGPAGWNGTITPPISGTPSGGNAPAGFSVGSTVISIGSPYGTLVFDKPVTILFVGVTGTMGYRPSGSDTWYTITSCGGSYATPTLPTAPGECAISNETDTKIVTYHFTTFGLLILDVITPAATPTTGGGGCTPGYTLSSPATIDGTAGSSLTVPVTISNIGTCSGSVTVTASVPTGWTATSATTNLLGANNPSDTVNIIMTIPADAATSAIAFSGAVSGQTYTSATTVNIPAAAAPTVPPVPPAQPTTPTTPTGQAVANATTPTGQAVASQETTIGIIIVAAIIVVAIVYTALRRQRKKKKI